MKRLNKTIFWHIMILCLITCINIFSSVQAVENGTVRYTVLVLDTSGSMDGRPASAQKEAATKFCESMLSASGENYVAIVKLNSSAQLVQSFTNDLTRVKNSITSLSTGGSTNMFAALKIADTTLSQIADSPSDRHVIKNIILCSDGLPQDGETSLQGPYTSSDYSNYKYANAVYNQMETLKSKYNIYTLGFFHNMNGNTLEFGKRFMADIQNKGNYIVTDPDELYFAFEDVAHEMTQTWIREEYVKQHNTYYEHTFHEEVTEISAPDSPTYETTNEMLGNLVVDAANSGSLIGYSVARVFVNSINFKFDFVNASTTNYELLLADIVTSPEFRENLEEAAWFAVKDDIGAILGKTVDEIFGQLGELSVKTGISEQILRAEWEELARNLDQMNITDDPAEYGRLFGKCSITVDKYINKHQSHEKLKIFEGKKGEALGAVAGAITGSIIDTASDVMTYFACYDAYCTANDMLKESLVGLAIIAQQHIQIANLDERYYAASLISAIESFLENSQPDATKISSVALNLAKKGLSNIASNTGESLLNFLAECIPYVREFNLARKAIGAVASGTMLLVEVGTTIDDRAYAASMVCHMYYLANYAAELADDLGMSIPTYNDPFTMACRFDEAIRIWRCASLMLCDFGMEYETLCLQESQRILRLPPLANGPLTPIQKEMEVKKASWYSTAIAIGAVEKMRISNIHCHDSNFIYHPETGIVTLRENAKVIMIACPVTVYVTDASGNLVATLSDTVKCPNEYKPYFHVMETENGSGDYMKVCLVPDDWEVTFSATGSGDMIVLAAEVKGNEIKKGKVSEEITVESGMEGHISEEDDIIVIDQYPSYSISIGLDQETYVCNVGDTVQITATIYTSAPYESGKHKFIGYFAYLDSGSWEQVSAWYIDGGAMQIKLRLSITDWEKLGKTRFTVSVFPVDHFATGWSLKDYFFYVYVLGKNTNILHLPAYTRMIKTEAFRSTIFQQVVIPEGTKQIESKAFSDMQYLRQINIPDSVVYIADDAFENSPRIKIICETGSYASQWLKNKGVLSDAIEIQKNTDVYAASAGNEIPLHMTYLECTPGLQDDPQDALRIKE